MIKIYSPEAAQKSILKRISLDDTPITANILKRIENVFGSALTPDEAVRQILKEVRENGNNALRKWSAKLDGLDVDDFRIPAREIETALGKLTKDEQKALDISTNRIKRFYNHQPTGSWRIQDGEGFLGQVVRPIRRIGIYVPGGTAAMPSTILMSAIPAQVAGVKEIVLVVPPERSTGKIASITLATAGMLGLEEIYSLGGAQAIAALAFGTDSISPVDKIFGPGNLFVTLAKRQVFGTVGIDGLAGPTETMIIADDTANPEWVAADMLAQAEHDVLASAILLTSSQTLAESVQAAVERQRQTLPRAEIVAQSLERRSGIVLTKNIDQAIAFSNAYAPEHLCLSVNEPYKISEQIYAAGGIFLGEYSCEVLGDYVAGPSHVMPTNGTARFASPLNLCDFVHLISLVALDDNLASSLSSSAALIARTEGLEAHARAADARKN